MGPIRAERLQAYADCLIAAVHQVMSCRRTEIEYLPADILLQGLP